jgi:sugar phosphate isomerase/epimerase
MADNQVGMNLVTLKGGRDPEPDLLLQLLDCVVEAGLDGVGLWVAAIEKWLAGGRSIADLSRALADRGLNAHEICFVGALDADGNVADRRREFEWAAELGAPAVITLYGAGRPMAQAQADWAEFVGKVEDTGVAPAFEFVGMWDRYCSPGEAWDVIKDGPALGAMVFDTFHFWRGGGEMAQLDVVPAGRIALVHLNDVNDVPREQAADSDRTYPGEGTMNVAAIAGALVDSGFAGPFSIEIFGPVQQQDPSEVSRHAAAAARRLIDSL